MNVFIETDDQTGNSLRWQQAMQQVVELNRTVGYSTQFKAIRVFTKRIKRVKSLRNQKPSDRYNPNRSLFCKGFFQKLWGETV